jgi:alpha-acetolactate decarboxylase
MQFKPMTPGNHFYFVKDGKEFVAMITKFDANKGVYHLSNGDSFDVRYITGTNSDLCQVIVHKHGWK